MVMDFVSAAAAFLKDLTEDPVQQKKGSTEVDECVHVNDRDSVLGSQSQEIPDERFGQDTGRETLSWETIRKFSIPSCVEQVSFTISAENLTPRFREQLKVDYPSVTIVTPSTKAQQDKAREALAKEKPTGVKQMIIELEETEVTRIPELESSLRKRYPWALIEVKPGPNISRKRARRLTDSEAATPRRPDPIKHIEDFAAYVMEPPSDDEFGYNYPIGEGWDRLTYARKFEVAHARAIQNYHGKVADGGGCSQCVNHGDHCKVYLPQLGNLSHLAFGPSCQHCRLRQVPCDFATSIRVPPSTPTAPVALRLDTQNTHYRGEVLDTPPPITTTPRTLASRMTRDDRTRFSGEEDEGHTPITASPDLPVLEFADRINLLQDCRHPKIKSVIYSIYGFLRKHGKVEPYGKYHVTIDQYYQNLITLYILTYLRGEFDSAFIILLRFQNTNYQEQAHIVSIDNAVRAFEYLPNQAPLCRWIAIVYSFLWDTQGQGPWDALMNRNPNIKTKVRALAKFLHGICFIRDPFTTGGDIAVRKHWCEVHNHPTGTDDQLQACENMKTEFGHSAEEAERRWNEREIQQAEATLARLRNGSGVSSAAGPSAPRIGEKRNAEGSPMPRPFKAGRGGRGRGRTRSPSR
jgi:hypothetical protein